MKYFAFLDKKNLMYFVFNLLKSFHKFSIGPFLILPSQNPENVWHLKGNDLSSITKSRIKWSRLFAALKKLGKNYEKDYSGGRCGQAVVESGYDSGCWSSIPGLGKKPGFPHSSLLANLRLNHPLRREIMLD